MNEAIANLGPQPIPMLESQLLKSIESMKIGQRFARLVAVQEAERAKSGNQQWTFQCDCGNITIARVVDVTRGFKRSCGCLQKETSAATAKKYSTTHGMFGTSEYNTWAKMIQRCINPRDSAWKYYGARGIQVCKRWRNFENFLADMGKRPKGKNGARPIFSIDRIDNNGNYEPGNCRWATYSQQMKNKRYPKRRRDSKGRFI